MVKEKFRSFPLAEKYNPMSTVLLFDSFGNPIERVRVLPDYIQENLKHQLRPYQKMAIEAMMTSQLDDTKMRHMLFNMATGSGKTDVMAALILYLYAEKKMNNFIFTVHSTAIIEKTKDNLINEFASKYLFDDPIIINGSVVNVEVVNTFPSTPDSNTIYILFMTYAALLSAIKTSYENGVTLDYFSDHAVTILSDESHHLNADTRTGNEKLDAASWEQTVFSVFESNSKNIWLEFTATLDFQNDKIYNKYRNVLLYRYVLKDFVSDKYSKNVFTVKSDDTDEGKMLETILTSQYRKQVASDNGISIKPVVFFKSANIDTSITAHQNFIKLINNLTGAQINEYIQARLSLSKGLVFEALSFWSRQNRFVDLATALRRDFNRGNLINVNVRERGAKDLLDSVPNKIANELNTLEEEDNEKRAIFAVAKLNEGWDVLNLYDIVRISENAKSDIKSTDSEAQLVGRGARFNPYVLDKKRVTTRQWDDSDNPMHALEELQYHTVNDSSYIKTLQKSFDKINLPTGEDTPVTYNAKVKQSFRDSSIYRNGRLYQNKTVELQPEEINSISDLGAPLSFSYSLIKGADEATLTNTSSSSLSTRLLNVKFSDLDSRILYTAVAGNKFYRFNNLKKYVPNLLSMDQFITDDLWLAGISANLTTNFEISSGDLSGEDYLRIVDHYLHKLESSISTSTTRLKGTLEFEPKFIRKVVKDYSLRVHVDSDSTQKITRINANDKGFYPYDFAVLNQNEQQFVLEIDDMKSEFKKRFDAFYLLRNNEKNSEGLKLHEWRHAENFDSKHYEGFMPDFVLYLIKHKEDEDEILQVYLEPKTDDLKILEQNKWKEELMAAIDADADQIIFTDGSSNIRLYGTKFYNRNMSAGQKTEYYDELKAKIFE